MILRCVFILCLSLFFACQKNPQNAQKNQLNLALSSQVSTLDSALSYDTVSAQVVYQIYEPLYEYDYLVRPYTLRPLIAAGMPTVKDHGLTYEIKLKAGVFYHPHEAFKGKREVVAQDFVNQIKRLAFQSTQSNGWWLFKGKVQGLDEFRKKAKTLEDFEKFDVKGLVVKDKNTLVIKLTKPYPQLVYALAMSFTAPAPIELILHSNNDFSQHPIGSGPFLLQDWSKNLSLTLVKNPDYHHQTYPQTGDRFANENKMLVDAGKKLPFLDQVKFHIMTEAQPRMQSFLTGKIDVVTLTKDYFQSALDYKGDLSKAYKDKNIQLQIAPTLTYWWLSFNMNDPLLGKNLKLRQAIAHAVNNEKLIELFTNNIGQKANSIYPPGIPGYDPTADLPYAYDPIKAKKLLEQAGHPRGKGLPVFTYDVRGSSSVARQMGEFIKSELAKIGIEINVVMNTFPGFLRKARNGQLQFWQGGWAMDYPDAENIIQLLISSNHPPGPNTEFYSNPSVDRNYQKLFATANAAERKKIMKEVETQVHKDLPWIMQYYARNYVLYHQRVKNFRQSDLMYNFLKYLRVQ